MKVRALRHGVMTEFEFEDLGEAIPGFYVSGIHIPGERPAFIKSLAGGGTTREDNDAQALRRLGFSGQLSAYGRGGWMFGVLDLDKAASMTGISSLHLGSLPAIKRAPVSIRPGAVNFATWAGHSHLIPPPPPQPIPPSGHGLPRLCRPDPKQPDTLGWRSWLWHEGHSFLMSPHHHTAWPQAHLTAASWSEEEALRGSAGIHARLVPRHWRILGWPDDHASNGLDSNPVLVTGIVERFGRYVMGREGWRAEQVVIRELMAPSTEIGLLLEQVYPDVVVHYPDQEEEEPCKSAKSSALEKGSRMLLPSTQPAPVQSSPPAQSSFQPTFSQMIRQSGPNVLMVSSPPYPPKKSRPDYGGWILVVVGVLASITPIVLLYLKAAP